MNNTTITQAQQFAAAYAADMAASMLKTIKYVRWAAAMERDMTPAAETAGADEATRAARAQAARKGAETRRLNVEIAAAKAEAKREARRQRDAARRVAQAAPHSSYPAVVLTAADKEALKSLLPS